jgi:hypothetical protein
MSEISLQDVARQFEDLIAETESKVDPVLPDLIANSLIELGVDHANTLRPRHDLFTTADDLLPMPLVQRAIPMLNEGDNTRLLRVIGLWGGDAAATLIANELKRWVFAEGCLAAIGALRTIGGATAALLLAEIAQNGNDEEAVHALHSVEDIASLYSPEAAEGGSIPPSYVAETAWRRHGSALGHTPTGKLLTMIEAIAHTTEASEERRRCAKEVLEATLAGAEAWLLRQEEKIERTHGF